MKLIDDFLNGITMYRLMLYLLIFLLLAAGILSLFRVMPFNFFELLFSTAIITAVCWVVNKTFSKIFKVPTNVESVYITALILALIITPVKNLHDLPNLFWIGVIAMASKYIIAIQRKHIFNPAAFAVAISAIALNFGASWWVGTTWMVPFVLLVGLLVVRKVQRFDLVFSFFVTALVVILGSAVIKGNDLVVISQRIFLDTPILFFAFIMLTEPQTTPPTKKWQMVYGGLVGALFLTTPENALLVGNIFSYLVSPKEKLILRLKQKLQIAPDIYDFIFERSSKNEIGEKFNFVPGQYMEWTLSHPNPDSRGVRRYFTIASSPTEEILRIGVKFYPKSSSFKKMLLSQKPGDKILAGQLAGDFTLSQDTDKKLCFIAGGIGITPFRSMIKYLLDKNEKRDIVLLFSNRLVSDVVYKNIFDKALEKLNIKTVYVLTDEEHILKNWTGMVGHIDAQVIAEEVPDYKDRIFYISGPHSMVEAFKNTLQGMSIIGNQIKVDFFPGYT